MKIYKIVTRTSFENVYFVKAENMPDASEAVWVGLVDPAKDMFLGEEILQHSEVDQAHINQWIEDHKNDQRAYTNLGNSIVGEAPASRETKVFRSMARSLILGNPDIGPAGPKEIRRIFGMVLAKESQI